MSACRSSSSGECRPSTIGSGSRSSRRNSSIVHGPNPESLCGRRHPGSGSDRDCKVPRCGPSSRPDRGAGIPPEHAPAQGLRSSVPVSPVSGRPIALPVRGIPVEVFERSGHLGGLAMTLPVGGNEIEKYYHHWFTSDAEVLDLLPALGLKDRLRWPSPIMGMFCEGRIWRFMSPMDLLWFRPLSFPAKLRFGLRHALSPELSERKGVPARYCR